MNRDPSAYSRILVLGVLLPLLLLDLVIGLPQGVFVGLSAVVFAVAAGIHLYGGESRAAAGWLVFGGALALVALVDLTADRLYIAAFAVLLVAGLLLLASQRTLDGDENEDE